MIPLDVKTVLDVGCGRGMLGCLLKVYREPSLMVAVDAFRPYLDFIEKLGVYDSAHLIDVARSSLPFEDKKFDLVLCLEVIEHLRKADGEHLLDELERVGRRVIISTPGVFFEQPQFDGNVSQAHLSFYPVKEFERRGYRVYGVGGLVILKRQIPHVSGVLARFTFRFPRISSTILAVKDDNL